MLLQGNESRRVAGSALRHDGQREVKCGPLVGFGLGPNPASVAGDDSLDDGQPHPCAFKLFLGVQPLKHLEQPGSNPHIESGAVIAHKIHDLPAQARRANFEARRGGGTGEFERVRQEIGRVDSRFGPVLQSFEEWAESVYSAW